MAQPCVFMYSPRLWSPRLSQEQFPDLHVSRFVGDVDILIGGDITKRA